ncbi:MAG: hypothetical protein K6E78_01110 [Treponema sp.]|nr:hypothetical protein [Treponema sp.]
MANENKKVADSLFVELFSDNRRFLELYNALSNQHLKLEETKITDSVIKDTIYRSLKNDVCKIVNDKLVVLIEQQSTVNKNMPLRCLLYIARIYEMLVPKRERYYRSLRKIPKPEFYVLYTGIDDISEYEELKLSDAFICDEMQYSGEDFELEKKNNPKLELEVPVINVRPGKNLKILENCNTLREYSQLIEKIHSLLRENSNREEVFMEAIKWGLDKDILKGYLEQAVAEVLNMLVAEYNYEEDLAVQREEAFESGLAKGKLETAKNLLKLNILTVEQIASSAGLQIDEIKKLRDEIQ